MDNLEKSARECQEIRRKMEISFSTHYKPDPYWNPPQESMSARKAYHTLRNEVTILTVSLDRRVN